MAPGRIPPALRCRAAYSELKSPAKITVLSASKTSFPSLTLVLNHFSRRCICSSFQDDVVSDELAGFSMVVAGKRSRREPVGISLQWQCLLGLVDDEQRDRAAGNHIYASSRWAHA